MFCKYCGHVTDPGSTFCDNCGKPIREHPQGEEGSHSSGTLSYQAHFASAMKKQPVQKEDAGTKTAIIIAVVATLLLLTVLAIIFVLGDTPSSTQNDASYSLDETLSPQNRVDPDSLSQNNPYYSILMSYESYVLPNSSKSYLCYADLTALSQGALKIAQEEIHARHGRIFTDSDLQAYFEARSWYDATSGNSDLNEYEKSNIELIRVFLAKQNGSLYQSGNRYLQMLPLGSQYILRSGSSSPISGNELRAMSSEKLALAKNEIYARHGCIFNDSALQEYFYSLEWYKPTQSIQLFDAGKLSNVERNNIALIEVYETISRGDLRWSGDNPYRDIFYDYSPRDYILVNSSSDYLEERDLFGMSVEELCLARNEIFARHGYSFQATHLMEYFLHHDWYTPNTPFGDASSIYFSQVEYKNIDLLNEAENTASKNSDRIFHGSQINLNNLDTSLTYTVSCQVFSMRLPAYFRDYAHIFTNDTMIDIYDKASSEAFGGGHLFDFYADNSPGNHDIVRELGYLENSNGDIYFLHYYGPTDVQFSPETAALYNKMSAELSRILPTITGVNGFVFTPID